MLRKLHQIDIIVNNEPVELYDVDKLNLRINNVIYQPESMTSKTGEYSFSFEIPATKRNNEIFNYANNLSKLNKFNTLYNCVVNVDGIEIFKGTLRLSGTSEKAYTCNLISLKINKIEDIFGDTMMNELEWRVPFEGTTTINSVNDNYSSPYYFPLVCYGAFQKNPYATYGDSVNMYTDLFQIDYWNKWYWESFHPSFNLVELVRRCFAHKGYTLNGDILSDNALKQIYLSEYINSEQDPVYNLNNDKIGKLEVAGFFKPSTTTSRSSFGASTRAGTTTTATATRPSVLVNDLGYPKGPVYLARLDDYDYEKVFVHDIFATPATTSGEMGNHHMSTPPTNSYLYRQSTPTNTSGFIVIPADGLYMIELQISTLSIAQCFSAYNIAKYKKPKFNGDYRNPDVDYDEIDLTSNKNFDTMPVEIQLVRNTDEPELIWTRENVMQTGTQTGDAAGWTQYPHETNNNALVDGGNKGTTGGVSSGVRYGGNRSYQSLGDRYFVEKGTTIAYDPKVNEGFILGFTTANQSPAVLKNGRSWDPTVTVYNQTHYRQPGYKKSVWNGSSSYSGTELTEKNYNSLSCPYTDYWRQYSTTGDGRITAVVELKKNDRLYLKMLTKGLYNLTTGTTTGRSTRTSTSEWGTYDAQFNYRLTIQAYTDKTDKYLYDMNMYYQPSNTVKAQGWGTQLNLGNFLNKSEKMSDFINNFIKTFNLVYNQDGTNVYINKNKIDNNQLQTEVDIDDRVNSSNATTERIDYPGTMQVKWAIAEDEAGAYRSIDTVAHQGANNWKDYIDRGSEKVQMDTTNESQDETVESKFSYCWYQDFNYVDYDRTTGQDNGHTATFRLPLIAKDEDFIIQNDDAMSKDGLSLKQRMWFRQQSEQESLQMWNGDEVVVHIPTDSYNETTLNFYNRQGSLLDRYFNIVPRTDSNYLTVECYISPVEYLQLKNGAYCKFDNDLYIVSEIQGYDPSGSNTTELKLIKK